MGVAKLKVLLILKEYGMKCLIWEVRLVTIVNFICWNAEKQNQIAFVDEAFLVGGKWKKLNNYFKGMFRIVCSDNF